MVAGPASAYEVSRHPDAAGTRMRGCAICLAMSYLWACICVEPSNAVWQSPTSGAVQRLKKLNYSEGVDETQAEYISMDEMGTRKAGSRLEYDGPRTL